MNPFARVGIRKLNYLSGHVGKAIPPIVSKEEAVSVIKSNDTIFMHGTASVPLGLIDAMVDTLPPKGVENVTICQIHCGGESRYAEPQYEKNFRTKNFFVGANQRKAVAEGRSDFVPVFLSDIPRLFHEKRIGLNVCLLSLSPPDKHGYCSLGPSVAVSVSAAANATLLVGQINKYLPRTHGAGFVHLSAFDKVCENHTPLPIMNPPVIDDITEKIGKNVASLIEDRACLQMGIGAIPDAVLSFLHDRKDLGIHTEMFSEGVIDLVEQGVVTNKYKKILPNVILGSFLIGTERLYNFVDDNPFVQLYPTEFVNSPEVIKKNDNVIGINSALEVDLTGQICADSIGDKIFSGTGGQVDFERGAALSKGGKPIIALPSRTKSGISRITAKLRHGAGVVTTRSHVHYIATEYGVTNLFGKTLRERAKALIELAHPDDRASLEEDSYKSLGSHALL